MNIAHIIPYSVSYPLPTHNGRYDWVLELATRQAVAGHTVTVYGNPNSSITGVRTTGIPHASDDKRQNNIETLRLAFQNNHDVYHSHFDNLHYEVASETSRPIVATQHWWPSDETIQAAHTYSPKNVWAVPPTKFMYEKDLAVGITSLGHIYHGVDLEKFRPSSTKKTGRLAIVGRIAPEKNLDLAIRVATQAGIGLDIIGKVAPKNQAYWEALEPLIDGELIRYLGPMNQTELIDAYTSAKAVLFPSEVGEAFGLVAIEAQACGTPVIMKRGGSRGELLKDGITGFLCASDQEFVSAITSLDAIHPDDCIAFASAFSITGMVEQYDELYKSVAGI